MSQLGKKIYFCENGGHCNMCVGKDQCTQYTIENYSNNSDNNIGGFVPSEGFIQIDNSNPVFNNIIQGLHEAIEYERSKNKMDKISKINIIREFKNEDRVCGVYSVIFLGKQEIFIRNGNSIGAVRHYLGEPTSKCVGEIRDDVKQEFLRKLEYY